MLQYGPGGGTVVQSWVAVKLGLPLTLSTFQNFKTKTSIHPDKISEESLSEESLIWEILIESRITQGLT